MSTKSLTFLFNLEYVDPSKKSKSSQSDQENNYGYLEQIYQSVLRPNSNHFIVKSFKRIRKYSPQLARKEYYTAQCLPKDSHQDSDKNKVTQDKNEATKKQNPSNQTRSIKSSQDE